MADARLISEHAEGLAHTFQMSLDGRVVQARVDDELKKLSRTARLPGFRPGRVPVSMLRRRYGTKIRQAVVDRLAIGVAGRLIAERELQPISRPSIHIQDDSNDPVTFALVLEVAPPLELGEVGGYELERLRPADGDPELEQEAELALRRQLFDQLVERYDVAVPPDMVDNEYQRIARGFEDEVGEAVDGDLGEELRSLAERRIRLAILLTEIGNAHDIRVPREEVESLLEQQAGMDPEHRDELIDYYLDHPTALAELQSPLFEERVVEFLLARSRIADRTLDADALRAHLEDQ